jgi:hypothetical protein
MLHPMRNHGHMGREKLSKKYWQLRGNNRLQKSPHGYSLGLSSRAWQKACLPGLMERAAMAAASMRTQNQPLIKQQLIILLVNSLVFGKIMRKEHLIKLEHDCLEHPE